jgi:hypothetical protein
MRSLRQATLRAIAGVLVGSVLATGAAGKDLIPKITHDEVLQQMSANKKVVLSMHASLTSGLRSVCRAP